MMRPGVLVVVSSALLFLFGPVGPHLMPSSAAWSAGLLVDELYPSAPDGAEYFVLVCTAYQVPLDGWTVTDGEGTVSLKGGVVLATGERLVVSCDPSSYLAAFGEMPDIGLDGSYGGDTFSLSGTFRMADDGDGLSVITPDGIVSDVVAYGDSAAPIAGWMGGPVPAPRAGEVFRRVRGASGPLDTDCASDWFNFREHRYGYTEWPPVSAQVPAGQLTAFVSPECSLACILDEIDRACESIRLCAYEASSPEVCLSLCHALRRGVDVKVLVDGAPAGGISDDGLAFLSVLEAGGGDVREFTTVQEGSVRHVLALHAKYIVVDSMRSVVLSENFVDDGLPGDIAFGNRGWGVAFTSPLLSSYLARVFDDDCRADRKDVMDWGLDPRNDPLASLPCPERPERAVFAPLPAVSGEDSRVALLVSPDLSRSEPYLCGLVRGSSSIIAEQFQADALWESRWTGAASPSPLITAIGDAVRSGGTADVLLDSSWYNTERNSAAAASLSAVGANARLMADASPVTALHNKGLVLDSGRTIVSSNNWVCASYARNRELAAVITSGDIASYFTGVFALDWAPDSSPPSAEAGTDASAAPGEAVSLSACGSADDRSIVEWEWDVGCDGTVDGSGPTFDFSREYPSTVTVSLTVTDAWGNSGVDEVTLTFGTPTAGSGPVDGSAVTLGDAAAAVSLVAVPLLLALRKTLISRLRDCLSACSGQGSSRTATSRGSLRSSSARSGRRILRRSTSRSTTSGRKVSSSSRRPGG